MKLRRRPNYRTTAKLVLEPLEARQVLAATPVPDFFLEVGESPDLVHFADLEANLVQAHSMSGVAAVRDTYGLDGYGQTVVIVDSGIAWDHQALGQGFGTGAKVVGGWDFAENDADPYDDAPAGFHGTHVAGIVASNDAVYVGVAPNVDLVALRVFNDSGAGYFSWVEQALRWVHSNRNAFRFPITTVNMSLGTAWNSTTVPSWSTIEDELQQLVADGITVTVAAGNGFAQYQTPGLSYPAASPYVIPVMSVSSQGQLSSFSQRHSRAIGAPGERIVSTVPDHALGADGIANDFAAASGTSMAAPYLAGIAVLVRQAMQFVGLSDITPHAIYQHLRMTADTLYDAATAATYLRVNAQRAIASLMPADDYGSTPDAAHALGTFGGTHTVSGTIHRLDDVDYFRFVAGQTGQISIRISPSHWLVPELYLTGANVSLVGEDLTFHAVAGESYTLAVRTKGGIGHYQLTVAAPERSQSPTVIDWGTVASKAQSDVALENNTWYRVRAANTGLFTIEARSSGATVGVEVQTPTGQRLAQHEALDQARVDIQARAGQELLVRFASSSQTADVQLVNLLQINANNWRVFASPDPDVIHVALGTTTTVIINGVNYRVSGNSARSASLQGFHADDTLYVVGTSARETWALQPKNLTHSSSTTRLSASGFGTIELDGNGSSDTVNLNDSSGNDELVGNGSSLRLSGTGYSLKVSRFGSVTVTGSNGFDAARLTDLPSNDTYRGSPLEATLQGPGYSIVLKRFDDVVVESQGGGWDRATLVDSAGNDQFRSDERQSTLVGSGFRHAVRGFDQITVLAGRGYDEAQLEGSSGSDVYEAWGSTGRLTTSTRMVIVAGYDQVSVVTGDGNDQAFLQGTRSSEYFRAAPGSALFVGNYWKHQLSGVETLRAGSGGSRDTALFIGSPENDIYIATPTSARLQGAGYSFQADGFSRVTVQGGGGTDTATVYGRGRGDRYQEPPGSVLVSGNGYTHRMEGFSSVAIYSSPSGRLLRQVQQPAPSSNTVRPSSVGVASPTTLASIRDLVVTQYASQPHPQPTGVLHSESSANQNLDLVFTAWPTVRSAAELRFGFLLDFSRW